MRSSRFLTMQTAFPRVPPSKWPLHRVHFIHSPKPKQIQTPRRPTFFQLAFESGGNKWIWWARAPLCPNVEPPVYFRSAFSFQHFLCSSIARLMWLEQMGYMYAFATGRRCRRHCVLVKAFTCCCCWWWSIVQVLKHLSISHRCLTCASITEDVYQDIDSSGICSAFNYTVTATIIFKRQREALAVPLRVLTTSIKDTSNSKTIMLLIMTICRQF